MPHEIDLETDPAAAAALQVLLDKVWDDPALIRAEARAGRDGGREAQQMCKKDFLAVEGADGLAHFFETKSGKELRRGHELEDFEAIFNHTIADEADFRTRSYLFAPKGSPEQLAEVFGANGRVPMNRTRLGQLVKNVGFEQARAWGQQWGVDITSAKAQFGKAPADQDAPPPAPEAAKSTNPWSASPENLDRLGKYNARAIARQSSLVAANPGAAARIAESGGGFIGAVSPRSRNLLGKPARGTQW
jgi:hypothetical protein